MRRVKFITRLKVVEIPITYVVISAIGKMTEEQGFKSLKFSNREKKQVIFPNVDLAEADHQQQIDQIE